LNHQNTDVSSAVEALSPERTDELATLAVVAFGRYKSEEHLVLDDLLLRPVPPKTPKTTPKINRNHVLHFNLQALLRF